MKLFSRGTNTPAAAASGPASAVAPPAPVPPPAAAPAAAPAPEARPPAPDVSEILESSVKDISEKVARLASNLESSQEERASLESKLGQMEERMRKLSSLTEMISAQYNPFIGDAPPPREALPSAETGLAPPPLPEPALAAPSFAPPGIELSTPAPEAPTMFAPEPAAPAPAEAPAAPLALVEAPGLRVERFGEDFQSSLLLLKWADLLLQNAQSREGVAEMLAYYHNIGWLGDLARDQLQAYADGIAHDDKAGAAGEWRATAEFHEVSLLFLERLKTLSRGGR